MRYSISDLYEIANELVKRKRNDLRNNELETKNLMIYVYPEQTVLIVEIGERWTKADTFAVHQRLEH